MSILGILLIVVLVLALAGSWPGAFQHSAGWGYGPSGLLGLVLVVVVVLLLLGHL